MNADGHGFQETERGIYSARENRLLRPTNASVSTTRQHRMNAVIFAVSLLGSSLVWGAESPYAAEDWLREGLALQIPKFKRTTLIPHPKDKGIVAANCETAPSWWGRFRVFHQSGDKIDWIANEPESYPENCGHYILSCEWRYLEKLQIWVLEVFDSTHMGNGSLWLFTLEGHDLRVLLHTTARGKFLKPPSDLTIPPNGGTRLVEKHLCAEYRVPEGGVAETVFLTGMIAALDQEDKPQSTKPYSETWTWDAGKRVFSPTQP